MNSNRKNYFRIAFPTQKQHWSICFSVLLHADNLKPPNLAYLLSADLLRRLSRSLLLSSSPARFSRDFERLRRSLSFDRLFSRFDLSFSESFRSRDLDLRRLFFDFSSLFESLSLWRLSFDLLRLRCLNLRLLKLVFYNSSKIQFRSHVLGSCRERTIAPLRAQVGLKAVCFFRQACPKTISVDKQKRIQEKMFNIALHFPPKNKIEMFVFRFYFMRI